MLGFNEASETFHTFRVFRVRKSFVTSRLYRDFSTTMTSR